MSEVTYGPYTPVRQASNYYFVSGQVGIDPKTKEASPELSDQVHTLFSNLKSVLKTANLELDDVIKTTIFLKDINDYAAVNDIYVTYFNEPRPARSCVAVANLPKVASNKVELLIEIEVVVYKEQA